MSSLILLWNTIDEIMSNEMTFYNFTFDFWDIFYCSFFLCVLGAVLGKIYRSEQL